MRPPDQLPVAGRGQVQELGPRALAKAAEIEAGVGGGHQQSSAASRDIGRSWIAEDALRQTRLRPAGEKS
jgi:hypothetical protein